MTKSTLTIILAIVAALFCSIECMEEAVSSEAVRKASNHIKEEVPERNECPPLNVNLIEGAEYKRRRLKVSTQDGSRPKKETSVLSNFGGCGRVEFTVSYKFSSFVCRFPPFFYNVNLNPGILRYRWRW